MIIGLVLVQVCENSNKSLSSLSINTTKENSSEEVSTPVYELKEHYDMINTLGIGTYAYVRLATEKKSGLQVAIKTSRGRNSRDMLLKEYELLKSLSEDHIIKVIDFHEDWNKKESYLIMEYFNGQTLDEYVEENGIFTEEEARVIFWQLLSSIKALHKLGIAHRDIKPENILINEKLEVKIIDFNISKSKNLNSSQNELKFSSVFYTQISSPLYCAPELKHWVSYTESVDIWGLGISLFTMLCGSLKSFEIPYNIDEKWSFMDEIILNHANITECWNEFLMVLLSKVPEERPTTSQWYDYKWMK